jgi:lipopolysaccharide heptosyltransferase I
VRILFIKLSSIGDIVHALPALAAARRHLPKEYFAWVVDSRYAEILRGNELIDEIFELDTRSISGGKKIEDSLLDITSQLARVRRGEFDVSIDLQGLWKSAVIGRFVGAKKRWGLHKDDLREPSSRLFLTNSAEPQGETNIIRRNLALTGQALGFDPDEAAVEFPIFTTEAHLNEALKIRNEAGDRFAILNPGGGWPTKLWPAENFGRLSTLLWKDLGVRPVISVGPSEETLGELAMRSDVSGKALLVRPSLKGFYELAKTAAVYVGGDTGPTHIAAAAGTPVVALFGPTEWWRNGTLNENDICVERKDIGCRVNCHRRSCDKWICMDISVETVFDAVKKRLGKNE